MSLGTSVAENRIDRTQTRGKINDLDSNKRDKAIVCEFWDVDKYMERLAGEVIRY